MHAELTITHRAGEPLPDLATALPPADMTALQRSLVFGQNPQWQALVSYATETPQWRLVIYRAGPTELQLTVEPVQGSLKRACESVWRSVREGARAFAPKFESLEVVDEGTTQVVTRASVGFLPQTRRREFWVPLLVAAATALLLAIGGAEAGVVRGALPGMVAGLLALVVMCIDALRTKLVWHE